MVATVASPGVAEVRQTILTMSPPTKLPKSRFVPLVHATPRFLWVFAWLSVLLLFVGWIAVASSLFGVKTRSDLLGIYVASHFGSFVLGIVSCSPLGGISTFLSVLTFIGLVSWGALMAGGE